MNSTLRDADYYTLQFEKSQHGLLTTSSAHALSPLVKLTPRHEAHSRAEFGLSDLKSGRGAGVRDQFLMRAWPLPLLRKTQTYQWRIASSHLWKPFRTVPFAPR